MKTQDMEEMVIQDLLKNAKIILKALDADSQSALKGNEECIGAINVNLRTLAALNEVLIYYGDAGVFADKGNL